ncbi:lipopolysaccharide biosynthesis protein [Bacteroides sp. 224]|nr:lipopolysaccharide biosynthesis protein [Bacteroides sp. 224]
MKSKSVKGLLWSAIDRFSVQGMQFVIGVVIARFVYPSEFGLIAMLGVFLAIAQSFVDSGFSSALIQKKNRTAIDYSTVFFINIFISVIAYFLLWIASPFIASFYEEPQLILLSRCIGLNVVILAFSVVQRARLVIKLDFKTQAKASLISVSLSGIIGIYLAYQGYGVWALVVQTLLNNLLGVILLWIFAKWLPQFIFSIKSAKKLFAFGSKLLMSGLLHTIYVNLYSLVIGKVYSATDVGFYNRANSIALFSSSNIVQVITRAIYPIQCEFQDDMVKLLVSFKKYLRFSCFIIFPLMIGISVLSDSLILLILTDKWLPSAKLLSIICIAYMWSPIMMINNQMLNVRGRSDYFFKAEIIKKIIAIIILFLTLPFGVEVLCWGILFYSILDIVIIIAFVKRVVPTGYVAQIKEILPIFVLSCLMGIVMKISISVIDNEVWKIIVGFMVGIMFYFSIGHLFNIREFRTIGSFFKKKKL